MGLRHGPREDQGQRERGSARPLHPHQGRSLHDGFGLSPGITKEQRLAVESLLKNALSKLTGDLAGTYYPLTGMDEKVRQQLVDDHFLFVSGDRNLIAAGMERDWPEGRGIFHNEAKTFLLWVNEEDQIRIISMEKGGDVKGVFSRLARGIKAVGDSVKAECGKDFALSEQYGYIHSCPTNLGTGMRASVMIDLPGYTKEGLDALKKRCEELAVQPRVTRGESGGFDGCTYDVSNKHRLGHSEVELIQTMIDGVNTLWEEDKAPQKKHGLLIKTLPSNVTLWAFSMFWTSNPNCYGVFGRLFKSLPATLPFPNIVKTIFVRKLCLAGKLFVTSYNEWRDFDAKLSYHPLNDDCIVSISRINW